jgi:hypothetical protein
VTRKRPQHSHALGVFPRFMAVLLAAFVTTGALASTPPLFLPAVVYGTGERRASSVVVADINGDRKPDGGTVGVLLGNGNGTFRSAESYGSGPNPWSVAVADVNGDSKADLVVLATAHLNRW